MKTKQILTLTALVFAFNTAFSQVNKISNAEANRVLKTYNRNIHRFMNIEMCGSAFDGPAYMVKRAENYSLDRIIQITPAQQADLGQRQFHITAEPYLYNDPQALKLIRDIVTKLSAVTGRPDLQYHPYIINSKEINAYSTIGGYIYVTSALLNFVDSRDELAFVLGHEMGHIINNHVVRKIKKIALISYATTKLNFQQFSKVALNLNMTLSAPFDQIDEYDADRTGVELIKKAGYRQDAFNDLFVKFDRMEKKSLLSRFTSTHPSSANRRKCLNQMIGK